MSIFLNIFTSLQWNNFYGVFSFIWYVLLVLGLYQTFEKAGEQGWKAIIPIYNLYICFQIACKPSYFLVWAVLGLMAGLCSWLSGFALLFWLGAFSWILSILSMLVLAYMWYNLALSFGYDFLFALGLIFLNPIFIMILGFGASRYRGSFY